MTSLEYIEIIMKRYTTVLNKEDRSIVLLPQKPFFSLIWLHGLGDSAAGFLDYFQQDESPLHKGGKIALLQAPSRQVTIFKKGRYNSWFDILNTDVNLHDSKHYNLQDVNESLATIQKNVDKQVSYWKEQGIKDSDQQILKRILIGGFSQGCCISLLYGLTSAKLLGGVVGLSGNLFASFELKNKYTLPMLIFQGGADDVVPPEWTCSLYDTHLKDCPNFDFRFLPDLGHMVTLAELNEATCWILKLLQKQLIKP